MAKIQSAKLLAIHFLVLVILFSLPLSACGRQPQVTPTRAGLIFVTVTPSPTGMTVTPNPTAAPQPAAANTFTPTLTFTSAAIDTATAVPTSTPTPIPIPTATPTSTATAAPTSTPTPIPTPTVTPTSTPDLPPPAPIARSPKNNERIECEAGQWAKTVRMELEPVADPGGTVSYRIYINSQGSFEPLDNSRPETTYVEITAECGYKYVWTASASDSTGHQSPRSKEYVFFLVRPDTTGPTAPRLISPKNKGFAICDPGDTRQVTFKWEASTDDRSGVEKYDFLLKGKNDGQLIQRDAMQTSLTLAVECKGWWSWAVVAIDGKGNPSAQSETRQLYLGPDILPPNAPRLTSPADNARWACPDRSDTRNVTFQWDAVKDDSGIDRYHFELWTVYASGSPALTRPRENPQATLYTVDGLTCGQTYKWRVAVTDKAGLSSKNWSNWSTFTILPQAIPTREAQKTN